MPNGHETKYNEEWCKERHGELKHRIESLEHKFLWIMSLLLTNLGGIIAVLMTGGK